MAIPEKQLETWSHQGSVTQSSDTYNAIKRVLEANGTPFAGKADVFLQGSYGNDTNIWAESDVDIVVKLNTAFRSDLSELNELQKEAFDHAYSKATYNWTEFKRDVQQVLVDAYGNEVKAGDKAIAIPPGNNRRKADVIAAMEYRRYHKFNGIFDQSYDEGICFWNSKGELIANYPEQHSLNLTSKHQATKQWLKPVIRIMKNLRGRCVDDKLLLPGAAPSYYIEGLFYNVPEPKFGVTYEDCIVNAMNWIQGEADKTKLVCANHQYYLIRDNSHTCWPTADAEAFLSAIVKLWNDW